MTNFVDSFLFTLHKLRRTAQSAVDSQQWTAVGRRRGMTGAKKGSAVWRRLAGFAYLVKMLATFWKNHSRRWMIKTQIFLWVLPQYGQSPLSSGVSGVSGVSG